MPPEDDTATLTALATRALAAAGQGDMVWGHLAVRDPQGRGVWMKARGWGLEEITADRVGLGWCPGTASRWLAIHTCIWSFPFTPR
ncbi:class II aldolase/adducin head domain-containing protein [Fodinicola feengrottensis]|uniref:hypothetical protein n=1 Tax=Fodinicola feengrottensis TaxID=435914 RepID=UPI0024433DFD|nr:hypothetical protein [Fodinicola feengrottensis]